MTKKELLPLIEANHKKGIYGAPLMILEIYSDDEEVDETLQDMLLNPPPPPKPYEMFMGLGTSKDFDQMFKEYIKEQK